MAAAVSYLIGRFGLRAVFIAALIALAARGFLAVKQLRVLNDLPWSVFKRHRAGLIGIVIPIAIRKTYDRARRLNVGLAAVMTVQGIGASLSDVIAGCLVSKGSCSLSH